MFYSSAPLWDGSASDDVTCLDEQLTQAASLAGTIMPHGADALPIVAPTSKAGASLPPDPMVQNSVDRTAGTIGLAIAQMPFREPVSGSGILAAITFRGCVVSTISSLSST